jgi:hypothetical protein
LEIEIVNWDQFNPRRDQKTYSWFRLNNDLATDRKLFGLDAEQKYLWVCLLCEASKDNSGKFEVDVDYLVHITGIKREKLEQGLQKLCAAGSVRIHVHVRPDVDVHEPVHDRIRSQNVSCTSPTYERTNETYERDVRDETYARVRPDPAADPPTQFLTFGTMNPGT